jgi:small-conductance mechanosensitive channel/CRP-like cAMP-binding protein
MGNSAFAHAGMAWIIPSVIALAIVLLVVERAERRATWTKLSVLLVCVLGIVISGLLAENGHTDSSQALRGLSLLGEGLCVISLLGTAFFRSLLPRLGILRPRILQDVVAVLASLGWMFIWLRVRGVELTSLLATSAVLTAVVGLSLQDTLGNLLGGMAVQFDESIQVGDWIHIDEVAGRVVEIRWRYTAVETRNWETVIIPNSVLVKNRFAVLGRRQGEPVQWRRWVWFNVDYRVAPNRVIDEATKAICLAEIPNVAQAPQPNCVVMEFGDSVGRYALRYWLTDLNADDPTDSDVRQHLFLALDRAGIKLSIPAQAIFVTKESAKRKAEKADQALLHRIDALGRVELFHDLRSDERQRVAERLIPAPFARGDIMTRQGAEAHWLYLLIDGHADVIIEDSHGHSRKVGTLGPGDVFGEMGMMTGEPRRATILARTDVECFRLDKRSFQDIIQSRPELAESISQLLAQRRIEYDAAMHVLDQQRLAERLTADRSDILGKIRRFFHLDQRERE